MVTHVPNEADLKGLMIATETNPGTFIMPSQRMTQQFSASMGLGEIIANNQATGTFDRTARVSRAFADATGNMGGNELTYQELAIMLQYAVKGGVAGVSDANTVPGYTYSFSPHPKVDDIRAFSALYGVDGLPWEATGCRFDEFTISGDASSSDDFWKASGPLAMKETKRYGGFEGVATGGTTTTITMTGAAWTVNEWQGAYVYQEYGSGVGEVRQVVSNTTDTLTLDQALSSAAAAADPFYISTPFPTLSQPTFDTIQMEGTDFFLDVHKPSSSSIGTTNVSDRALSFSITQRLNLANKRRASGVIGRKGRGAREITGVLRFEYDRWDEYKKLIAGQHLSIRIQQDGPVIDASAGSKMMAQINVEKAAFNTWTEDQDNNNMTVSLSFRALTNTPVWLPVVKVPMATLP